MAGLLWVRWAERVFSTSQPASPSASGRPHLRDFRDLSQRLLAWVRFQARLGWVKHAAHCLARFRIHRLPISVGNKSCPGPLLRRAQRGCITIHSSRTRFVASLIRATGVVASAHDLRGAGRLNSSVRSCMEDSEQPVACSSCFTDQGLILDAYQIGAEAGEDCPNCGAPDGRKLTKHLLGHLAYRFFDWGSFYRTDFGGAPAIVFNEHQTTSVEFTGDLAQDVKLFEQLLGVGFFHYGPRLWMLGEIEPLKALCGSSIEQAQILDRIIAEYPQRLVSPDEFLYRIRVNPEKPGEEVQYDSPPDHCLGKGRFESASLPILYASPDLETCVHECRVRAEDETYVATLVAPNGLKLLNVAALLPEDHVTEFESLDIAVHMLFLAGEHSYSVARALAQKALSAGFDGIVYPSYFSLLRLGLRPFETVFGISQRRIHEYFEHEASKAIPNVAIFNRPIMDGRLRVKCINRLVLNQVSYKFLFGPVGP